MKCCWNLNFEKMDTASYTGKNDGIWLLWGIFKEHLKQNTITAVLRKANAHSVVICSFIKKSVIYIKIDPRGKIDLNFAYEVLVRRNWVDVPLIVGRCVIEYGRVLNRCHFFSSLIPHWYRMSWRDWVIIKFSSRKKRNDIIKKKSLNGNLTSWKTWDLHQRNYS